METMRSKLFLPGMVLAILGMLGFVRVDISAASPEGVLKEAIHWGVSADFFDPAITGSHISTFTLYLFHDALIKPMPGGSYTPCLAEAWEISPDAKVYEFHLRKAVKFHNGDPLTAEDVIFSFWRYKGDQAKFIHGKVEKVEAVTPHRVRFHFKEPFPDFLDYHLPGSTTIGWVVPKKYVERVGDAGFKKHPVGCGPYKFVEFVPGVRIIVEAFGDYWRKDGYWPMGEQMATYWKAVGITVDTVLLDRPAWMAYRDGGRMKGGLFMDTAYAPTIGGRLSYLFGSASYGNYPDIQALWEKYQRETAPQIRKALIGKIQELIREKVMFIPIRGGVSPAAFGPRVKGNPYKIQPLLWWTCPFEDIELAK